MRSRKIHSAWNGTNAIMQEKSAHPNVNFRYLAYQKYNKANNISELEFNGEKTWPLQE